MKKYLVITTLFLFFFSCSNKKEIQEEPVINTYQKEGITFDLPLEWKVKKDYSNEKGRYLELDKYSNYKVESAMAIGILNTSQPSDSIVLDQIKQLEFVYQKVNFKVLEKNKNLKLGKYQTSVTTYEADDTKNKVYGKICVIEDKGKQISIQIVENKSDNDISDYDTIFNTLELK